MNITKTILKNKLIKIIADDKSIVNNQTLKELIKKNSYLLSQLKVKKNRNTSCSGNNF